MDGQPVEEVVKEKDDKVQKSHDTTQFVQVISQTYHVFITAQLSGILNTRKIYSC